MIYDIIDFLLGLPRSGKNEDNNKETVEMTKYKLTLNHLEQHGGIKKLERDGFTRSDIHNFLHREMGSAPVDKHREIISKLYERKE